MTKLYKLNNVKKVILTSCLLALPSLGFAGEVLDPQEEYLYFARSQLRISNR